MANPQLEDGHTRIANELLDNLVRMHLSPYQWQVVFFVIRKTYGYRKKVDYITNSQIVRGTGIHKAHVSRAMSNLVRRNILIREGKLVGLQKDYEAWLELPELVTNVTQTGNNSTPEKLPDTQPKLPNRQPKLPVLQTKVTSPRDTQKKKETIQKKLYKRKYGEFQNVLLTDEEYQRLKDRLKSEVERFIENLSGYLESHKKKHYDSHYATILNWARRDKESGKAKGRGLPSREEYEPTADYPDL